MSQVDWAGMGWLEFLVFHCLHNSARADENVAEAAATRLRNIQIQVNSTLVHNQMGHPVNLNWKLHYKQKRFSRKNSDFTSQKKPTPFPDFPIVLVLPYNRLPYKRFLL